MIMKRKYIAYLVPSSATWNDVEFDRIKKQFESIFRFKGVKLEKDGDISVRVYYSFGHTDGEMEILKEHVHYYMNGYFAGITQFRKKCRKSKTTQWPIWQADFSKTRIVN